MRLDAGDMVRIPAGLAIGAIGVVAMYKAVMSFDGSGPAWVTLALTIVFGLVFLAIGSVMALGWLSARRKKRRKTQ